MGNIRKAQWAGLVALVVVIAVLVTVIGVQRMGQRAEAVEARDAYAVVQERQEQERLAAEQAEEERRQQELASRTETVKQSVSGTGRLTVSVLGDSTGNESAEWVGLWADGLADSGATVELHQWDWEAEQWADEPVVIGDGDRAVTIWNGSHPGATAAYPAAQDGLMQPDEPHLVITNYGHNGTTSINRTAMGDLLDGVNAQWDTSVPTVVTVQNPARGESEARSAANHEAVRGVAADRNLPVIDVNQAFTEAGELEALLTDEVHPNAEGSALWASTVASFFS